VQGHFLPVEVYFREQAIFREMEIGNADRRKEVRLSQLLELARSLEQEEKLRRQCGILAIAIEALQEWILLHVLEHDLAVETFGEAFRQAGLADANRAFDNDESWRGAGFSALFRGHVSLQSMRSIRGPVVPSDATSFCTLPMPGTSSPGAMLASGNNTKFRCAMPGCGIVRPGSSTAT